MQDPKSLMDFNFDRNFLRKLDKEMIVSDPIVFDEFINGNLDGVQRSAYLITRPYLLKKLANCKIWMVDATFFSAPEKATQVLIIYGNAEEGAEMFPLVYIPMNGKSTKTYAAAFKLLFNEFGRLRLLCLVHFVLTDYEITIMNTLQKYLPTADFRACFFHKRQNTMKTLEKLGLHDKFRSDSTFFKEINMVDSLAFVRKDLVQNFFNIMYDELGGDAKNYADFFKRNYIVEESMQNGNLVQTNARFDINWWNLYDLTLLQYHVTTSPAKASNKSLKKQIVLKRPGIYKFLIFLKSHFDVVETKMNLKQNGHKVSRLRDDSEKKNSRIREILREIDIKPPLHTIMQLSAAIGEISKIIFHEQDEVFENVEYLDGAYSYIETETLSATEIDETLSATEIDNWIIVDDTNSRIDFCKHFNEH